MVKCEYCGKEDRIATRDDLTGLTVFYDTGKLICDKCLRHIYTHIIPEQ